MIVTLKKAEYRGCYLPQYIIILSKWCENTTCHTTICYSTGTTHISYRKHLLLHHSLLLEGYISVYLT